MSLQNTITDIASKIRSNDYKNEAEVTNGIVLRVLNELNWPSYDTGKVKPQYNVNNNYVDLALCCPDNRPVVIIEIKAIGRGNDVDKQILKYAFDLGAPMAIFTDGQEWHFYLPAAKGELIERRFYKVDLLERPANEIAEILKSYLHYDEVKSDRAFEKAKNDLKKQYKVKEVKDNIPIAWNNLVLNSDEMLIAVISEKVCDLIGYNPENSAIIEFLKQLKISTNTNPSSIIERAVVRQKTLRVNQTERVNTPIVTISNERRINANNRSLIINGNQIPVRTAKDIMSQTLEYFIQNHPNLIDTIAKECQSRKRRLIDKDIYNLYISRPDLSEEHSYPLSNGYFMGTNYSSREYIKYIEKILQLLKRYKYNINIEFSF